MLKLIVNITVCCAFSFSLNGQKNDTTYLLNGDRLTGEIKKFQTGLLTLKTDALQTVDIEADRIKTIYSAKYFEFRTKSGYRYYGSILKAKEPGSIILFSSIDSISKPLWDIVRISRINQRFIQRIDGSIDLGLSYTKSIDVFQYSINGWTSYRSTNYLIRFDLTSILSESGDDDLAKNNDLGVNLTRFLPHKWFASVQVDAQENTELNLALRLQGGPAVGYDIVRTIPMRLSALVGLLGNQEKLIDSGTESVNVEGLLSLNYSWFKFRNPEIDITTGIDVYPSLSVSGRVRVEYDASIKFEIVTDVFLNVSYYQNFDNKPNAGGSSKNDYGIVTSLGYTF